jgi:hypothetical protein
MWQTPVINPNVHITDTDTAKEHRTASPLEHWRKLSK